MIFSLDQAKQRCFFIIGCQRTGTTLMRLILESHPQVHCYDESRAYDILRERSRHQLNDQAALIGFKIPRWTEQFDRDYISDNVDFVGTSQFYAGEPIVFMLRNMFDTAASMLKLKVENTTWLEAWGIRILSAKMAGDPAFCQTYTREIHALQRSGNSIYAVAALYWKYKTASFFRYTDRNWPVLGVHYENLVQAPELQVRAITSFLNLEWTPRLLQHHMLSHGEILNDGLTFGATDPNLPIYAQSVNQWQEIIPSEHLAEMIEIAGDLDEQLAQHRISALDTLHPDIKGLDAHVTVGTHTAERKPVCEIFFDQYQRYKIIADTVEKLRWKPTLDILDVGGSPATLVDFVPNDHVIVLDVADQGGLDILGDGLALPFRRNSFDIVVSSDTLEHIPSQNRQLFLAQLCRVAREAVIVGAPFEAPAVIQAEQVLHNLIRARYGQEYAFLAEHQRNGLPDLERTIELIQHDGFRVKVLPNGYLHRWLLGMSALFLLQWRFHDTMLNAQINAYYNSNFYQFDNREPAYRQVIVAARTHELDTLDQLCSQSPMPSLEQTLHLQVLDNLIHILSEKWSERALTAETMLAERAQTAQVLSAQLETSERTNTELTVKLKTSEQVNTELAAQLETSERTNTELAAQTGYLKEQLDIVHRSRWWKLAGLYWSILNKAKCIVRKMLPLETRRKFYYWMRRLRRREISTQQSESRLNIPPGQGIDIFCFPVIDWHFRFQRPQQLLTQFARSGHRVFYIRTTFMGLTTTLETTALGERIYQLGLPGDDKLVLYQDHFALPTLEQAFHALVDFVREHDVNEAVCLIQFPFWTPLAEMLRERYGWKIVYDCMDDHSGFRTTSSAVTEMETYLVSKSDLIVATSNLLYRKLRQQNERCILIPNAGDYAHFNKLPPRELSPLAELPRPVVGYYGAIAEWFDTGAIRHAATAHPDWSFALIGSTFGANLQPLKGLKNVHLLGEKPYAELPGFLAGFDICTIPFLRLPLTEATNPVKIFEYLSAGKPVVAAALPELQPLAELIYQYRTAEEFTQLLETALEQDTATLVARRQEVARENTWEIRHRAFDVAVKALYEKVSVIVVTWNSLAMTQQCLQSLSADKTWPNLEIIVVDNGSTDGTVGYLQNLAESNPCVQVILNKDNRGFAAANNQGITQAVDSDFVVLLNNDTVVPKGWLSRLLRYARQPEIGMVGPVTNWTGNEAKIDVSYVSIEDMEAFAQAYVREHDGQFFDINTLAMYCVILRRDVIDQVGMLDEQFGVGMFEDDDYAHRVREAGYRVICAEDAFVHHWGMASFAKLGDQEYNLIFEKNKKLFEAKWNAVWQAHQYRNSNSTTQS